MTDPRQIAAGLAARAITGSIMSDLLTVGLPQYRAAALNDALNTLDPALNTQVSGELRRGASLEAAVQQALTGYLARQMPAKSEGLGSVLPTAAVSGLLQATGIDSDDVRQFAQELDIPVAQIESAVQQYGATAARVAGGVAQATRAAIDTKRDMERIGAGVQAATQAGATGRVARAAQYAQRASAQKPAARPQPFVFTPVSSRVGTAQRAATAARLGVRPQAMIFGMPAWKVAAGGVAAAALLGYLLIWR